MVSWLMTLKAVLISSGVASVGLLLKVYVPTAVDFSVSQAPVLWSSLLSWLKPPYLYVLTNGIIITIVASSKYYRNSSHHEQEGDESSSPRMLEVKDLDPDAQFSFVAAKEEKIIDAVAMVEDESELKNLIMMENFPPKDSRFGHRESVKASTRGMILILFKFNLTLIFMKFIKRKKKTEEEDDDSYVNKRLGRF